MGVGTPSDPADGRIDSRVARSSSVHDVFVYSSPSMSGIRYVVLPPIGKIAMEEARSVLRHGERVMCSVLLDTGMIIKIATGNAIKGEYGRDAAIACVRAAGMLPRHFKMFEGS
jgi:hypothetical protein